MKSDEMKNLIQENVKKTNDINEKSHHTANIANHCIWCEYKSIGKNLNSEFKRHRHNKKVFADLKDEFLKQQKINN